MPKKGDCKRVAMTAHFQVRTFEVRTLFQALLAVQCGIGQNQSFNGISISGPSVVLYFLSHLVTNILCREWH